MFSGIIEVQGTVTAVKDGAETRELSQLTRSAYSSLPWKSRRPLADYIEQVRQTLAFTQAEHPRFLAWLALAVFAGVRPEELDLLLEPLRTGEPHGTRRIHPAIRWIGMAAGLALAVTVVWCKLFRCKLLFEIGSARAELPFIEIGRRPATEIDRADFDTAEQTAVMLNLFMQGF